MQKIKTLAIATAVALLMGTPATASTIFSQSRAGGGGNYGSAAGYKAAVDAYMLNPPTPGYGDAYISYFDGVNNGGQFGSNSNIVQRTTIDFNVDTASVWDFRFGYDFGGGGAIYLDGAPASFMDGDNWAGGDYDSVQAFKALNNNLGVGLHQLIVYGFEGCCDGPAFGQYRVNGGSWQTFAADDGLSPAEVPEPATLGLFGLGLAAFAAGRRRSRAASLAQ
ncbi:MAG: CCXG family PEP-CTERM protein [Sphingomonadaceae bacterium]|nr:CCXG family PEP-CTERM protein [Sphingomonadaceae bacterium]